jgi:glycosyltransferase involved in cell wall biosynthesis
VIRVALLAPSLHTGGAERQMMYLAAGLPRDEFDVRFLLMSERGPLADEAEALGIPVTMLGVSRERCRGIGRQCLQAMAEGLRRYRSSVRDIDIVDAWTVPAYTFAGMVRPLAGVPVVLAGRRSLPDVSRTRVWYRELARDLAMRKVDAVVSNSMAAADAAVTTEGIDRSRIHVIPNAVLLPDTDGADPSEIRRSLGLAPGEVAIACVASLREGKGHDQLIDLAKELRGPYPQLRFLFVGEGSRFDPIAARIEAEGIGDVVRILTGMGDARRLYEGFDIVVQASVSEGLPNVVLEAAAAGRPIVATSVGGTPEILTSGVDGILVPRQDLPAMRAAIVELLDSPQTRDRLGQAARERATFYSPEALVQRTSGLYRSLLERSRVRRGRDVASGPAG